MGTQFRVQVVQGRRGHERLGQGGDPANEMGPPVWIELAEDIVEQEEWRTAIELRQEIELGELEGKDGGPLLTARGERAKIAAGLLEDEIVAMRPYERGAVPDLLLGRLRQATLECVARRLPGLRRRIRCIAEPQWRHRGLVRGDLGVGPSDRFGQVVQEPKPLADEGAAGIQERAVPEPELFPAGLFLANRAEQGVALLKGACVRGELAAIRRRSLTGQRVQCATPEGRRTGNEEHLLGREHDRPEQTQETARPPRDAVDPDPLSTAGRGLAYQRDLDRRGMDGARRVCNGAFDAGEVCTPPNQLRVGRRAVRAAPGEENDRFQQAGLAGRIRPPDQLWPGTEGRLERAVPADVA
jgi:hypothetical protein